MWPKIKVLNTHVLLLVGKDNISPLKCEDCDSYYMKYMKILYEIHGSHWESWVGIMTQVQCQITPLGRTKVQESFKSIVAPCQGQKSTDAKPDITMFS